LQNGDSECKKKQMPKKKLRSLQDKRITVGKRNLTKQAGSGEGN